MSALDESDRVALGQLADLLIPAAGGMPSATEIDLQTKWIDRAVNARPEVLDLLRPAIDEVLASSAEAALETLRTKNEEALEAFFGTVLTCYYMHPGVRKRIGYPGQDAVPIAEGEAEYYLSDGLLDPVLNRGPIFRQVD